MSMFLRRRGVGSMSRGYQCMIVMRRMGLLASTNMTVLDELILHCADVAHRVATFVRVNRRCLS